MKIYLVHSLYVREEVYTVAMRRIDYCERLLFDSLHDKYDAIVCLVVLTTITTITADVLHPFCSSTFASFPLPWKYYSLTRTTDGHSSGSTPASPSQIGPWLNARFQNYLTPHQLIHTCHTYTHSNPLRCHGYQAQRKKGFWYFGAFGTINHNPTALPFSFGELLLEDYWLLPAVFVLTTAAGRGYL